LISYTNFRANEICKSKNKSKITVNDVLEAMEKAGFENFQSEIENLLMGKKYKKININIIRY
jgi:hypothetical protein